MKVLTVLTVLLLLGCKRPLNSSAWRPDIVGGVVELRQLPAFEDFEPEYSSWRDDGRSNVLRVFRVFLKEDVSKSDFIYNQDRVQTPMGNPVYTIASFHSDLEIYNGYVFVFRESGKIPRKAFDLSQGKELWVIPRGINNQMKIRLQIIAMEGLGWPGVRVVEP